MPNPWAPFISEEHFNFAAFLKRIKCPTAEIDALFKVKMPFDASLLHSFRSAYTLNSWLIKFRMDWDGSYGYKLNVPYNGLIQVHLLYFTIGTQLNALNGYWNKEGLAQKCSKPVWEYSYGIQQYHDINTANWRWKTQVSISSSVVNRPSVSRPSGRPTLRFWLSRQTDF